MTPRILRTSLTAACALALALAASLPATAVSQSGSDSRPVSARVFTPRSPFYQKLPTRTPAASNSAKLVASLNSQAHKYYGTKTEANVNINTHRYAPALYVAYNSDPEFDIRGWNCQRKWNGWDTDLNLQLRNVHLPVDMQPDPSSDGAVSVYNSDTDELVELWQARQVEGQWQACWGGKISNAGESLGAFAHGYGASASGLALWGGTIRQQELLDGHINHVISLAIPKTKRGTISWPANRTDGNTSGTQLAIGQMLRLPASLNLDKLKLSPVARTIARAAQEYGVMITDSSGSVAFSAENPIGLATNQYSKIFRGRWAYLEMLGNKSKGEVPFPLTKLVALPLNYQVPAAAGSAGSPVTTKPNTAYAAAVKAATPDIYWRLGDTGSTAADSSGKGRPGTMIGVSRYVPGAIAGNNAIVTYGDPSSGVYLSAASTPAKQFTVQVWFKTKSTVGGKILGFENTKTGKGSAYDRSLYLTNDGRLVFGVYNSIVKTVTTAAAYNDGAWHQAAATQGSNGIRLYVDGAVVGTNPTIGAQAGSGYWRLGGGNLDGWTAQPINPYFSGSLDEFAYYGSALSEATIAAQYRAAA